MVYSSSRVVQRARRWWEQGSYLEDVAWGFTVVTVGNSAMMITGWDTPKSGTFAYVHLLSRLAIVAAVVALFHLDDIKRVFERRGDGAGRPGRPTDERGRSGRSIGVLGRPMRHAPFDRVVVAFTFVTGVLCVVAIASSVWREPEGGIVLYQALLGLAAMLAVLVGGWARWHPSRPDRPGDLRSR